MLKSSRVEKLLNEKFYTRSDDKILYIEYMKEYSETYQTLREKEKELMIQIILEIPKENSLGRVRRHYQNTLGLYLPWIATINKRKQAQGRYRKEYKKDAKWLFDWLARWFSQF